MSANFLALFHDCLQSGYVLNPTGKSSEIIREETKIWNYTKSICYQIEEAVPALSAMEKNEFLRHIYLLYRDTTIKRLSTYQIKSILARRQAVDVIEFMYKVALKLEGSELLNSDSFWDYLIKFVDLKNTALDNAGESFLVRVWSEIISELVLLNREDSYSYPNNERDVLAVIQSVNTSRKFHASQKALVIIRTSSYSPAVASELVKLVILDSVIPGSSTPALALMRLLDHRPLEDSQKVRVIRNLLGVIQHVSFLDIFFSNLTNPWLVHIFGNKQDTYSFRLGQMEKIYVHNAGVFKKFDWGRMVEFEPTDEFPAPDPGVMVKKGGTFDCLVMMVYELLRNYSIPSYFVVKYLHQELSTEETKIFLYLLGGGNLSRYPDLPVRLTQRQAFLFSNFEEELARKPFDKYFYQEFRYKSGTIMGPDAIENPQRFAKLSLKYALAWIVCLDEFLSRFSDGKNTQAIRVQMESHANAIYLLKVILRRVMERYNDVKWVLILPAFLFRNSELIIERKIDEVLDYINNHIIRNEVAVNFKTKSWARLLTESDDWHKQMNEAAEHARNINILYPFSGIERIEIKWEADIYQIQQISSRQELRSEGLIMHHCVSSYDPMCAKGITYIFKVQLLCGRNWLSKLTIQVMLENDKVKIVQAKGKCNREPRPEENMVLQKWLKEARAKMKANKA
jgi:hypothetical protein